MAEKKSEPSVFAASPGDKNAVKAIDHYLMTDEEKLQAGQAERSNRREWSKPISPKKKSTSKSGDIE